jgi:hypothetical protein
VVGERAWAIGERVVVVFAMAAVAFIALAVTGTLPLPPPTSGWATEYCTQYQYNTCGPLVPPLLAFQSNRDGANNFEIYKMNSDGSTQTRLFSNVDQNDVTPYWSPDATRIVFSSTRDVNSEIYSMDAAGNALSRLTFNVATDVFPAWSPDGSKIAFASTRDGNFEIYVMNANGSSPTRLTTNAASDTSPAWSPDGTKIAFTSTRVGPNQIFVMNADGSGQTRLSDNAFNESQAAWSPNGQKIAYSTNRDGNFDVFVMNADGSGQTSLTSNPTTDNFPAWSPDGTKIAFATARDGNTEIYSMNANGSGQTRLTNNTAVDTAPNWQRTPPGAPTNVTATAAPGQATVSFTPPASNGGAAITSYTVTATPGGAQASGPASPITVSGLTNGTSYRFSVTATNGAGTGPASALSNAVIPPETLTVTIHATGVYGTTPNLTGLAPGNSAISYSPASAAGSVTGTLSCSTTATTASQVGVYPVSLCSGLAAAGFTVVYDYASSDYTVTKAPLTVTADDKSRLFGAANPPLTATLSGFVLGQTLGSSGVTGTAACTTSAAPYSAGGTYPIVCTVGSLSSVNYSFSPFVPGTLTVGFSQPCITGVRATPLTVVAGQSICFAPGAKMAGTVTVQAGGALDIESATLASTLRSTGAAAIRICGSTVQGGTTVTGTTGLVLIGGDAATGPCAGNTLSNSASVNNNSGGVEFNNNRVLGSLTIIGNTGTLPPPDVGPVHATGNSATGPINIQP